MSASKSIVAGVVATVALVAFLGRAPSESARAPNPAALVALGQTLFFDQRLSESDSTSCGSCHKPEYAFADRRRFSIGQRNVALRRNTPALVNRPAHEFQFWDGRALSLVDQALRPLEEPDEMGGSAEEACRRIDLLREYASRFKRVFGDSRVTPARVAAALAAYVESLRFAQSPFDQGSLTPASSRGEKLFFGKAHCSSCHRDSNFTDERFHNTGVAWKSDKNLGRWAISGREEDRRAFKTPTLRELVRTAPYMHDGSFESLEDVVRHYVAGGAPDDPDLDPAIRRILLSVEDQKDLVAFLRALSTAQ